MSAGDALASLMERQEDASRERSGLFSLVTSSWGLTGAFGCHKEGGGVSRFGDIVAGEARSASVLGEGEEGGKEGHGLETTETTNGRISGAWSQFAQRAENGNNQHIEPCGA